MIKKRFICGMAAAVFALSGGGAVVDNFTDLRLDISASADEKEYEDDDYRYHVVTTSYSKYIVIYDYIGDSTNVVIPSEINKVPVTQLYYRSFYRKDINSVVIPDSVTSIGDYAFCDCKTLSSVTLNEGLGSIGDEAFKGCSALKTLRVPKSVRSIDSRAIGYYYEGDGWSGDYYIYDDFTLYCYRNTQAQLYAIDNEINYQLISPVPKENPDVTYTPDYGCVNLSWNAVSGADRYAIYGEVDGKWKKLAETASTSYTLRNLIAGTTYKVAVIGKFNGTWYTDYSKAITVASSEEVIVEKANPEFTYTPGDKCIDMTWNAAQGAQKYAIYGMVNGKWTKLAETSETSYKLKNLVSGTKYEVAVIGMFNGAWYNDYSKSRSVTCNSDNITAAYPEVVSCLIRKSGHQATIEWEPCAGAEQYGIAVLVKGKWNVQGYTNADTTSFTASNLIPGTTYTLAICAKVNGKWDTTNIGERSFKVYAF